MSDPRDLLGPRKREHLELCLGEGVEFKSRGNGFAAYELIHDALPELHLDEIDLSCEFLGHALELPLMISSMTGGTEAALRINRTLAAGAMKAGCAMAVGSQRAALEDLSLASTFAIRDVAPDIPIFGNLGAVQLNYGYGAEECVRAVEMIQADGLFLHLNSLQEALQPEGDRDFRGLLGKIRQLSQDLPFPGPAQDHGQRRQRPHGQQAGGLAPGGAGGQRRRRHQLGAHRGAASG